MRKVLREVTIWEIGDYVITPCGVGKVVEVNHAPYQNGVIHEFQEVLIKLKRSTSEQSEAIPFSPECFSLITQEEYQKG